MLEKALFGGLCSELLESLACSETFGIHLKRYYCPKVACCFGRRVSECYKFIRNVFTLLPLYPVSNS